MEVKEVKTKKVETILDVICDCCGKSCLVHSGVVDNKSRDDFGETYSAYEYAKIHVNWGYFSGKDGQKWTAQICEKCIDEKFSFVKFKKEQYL